MHRTVTTALVGLACLVTVVGCSSAEEGTATAADATSAEATESSPSAAPSSSSSAESSVAVTPGDYTAPGTALGIGEPAVVPLSGLDTEGPVEVTVSSITAGTAEELASLELGDQANGLTPYYVTFTLTNQSDTDLAYGSLGYFSADLADGSSAQRVSIFGDFAPCESESAPQEFSTSGASYTTCEVFAAPTGSSVTTVEYGESGDDPAVDYSDEGIVWS